MKTIVTLIASALLLSSCGWMDAMNERDRQARTRVYTNDAADRMGSVIYTKDPRTALCYAVVFSGHDANISFTMVPCTDEVLKLIHGRP